MLSIYFTTPFSRLSFAPIQRHSPVPRQYRIDGSIKLLAKQQSEAHISGAAVDTASDQWQWSGSVQTNNGVPRAGTDMDLVDPSLVTDLSKRQNCKQA